MDGKTLKQKLAGLFEEALQLARVASESAANGRDLRVKAAELERQDAIKNADEVKQLRTDGTAASLKSWREFIEYIEAVEGIKFHLVGLGDSGQAIRAELQRIGYSIFPGAPPNVYDEDGRINGMVRFTRLANVVLEAVLAEPPPRVLHGAGSSSPTKKARASAERAKGNQYRAVYSRADDARFRRIGRDLIGLLTNQELWKRNKADERRLKPGTTFHAFRQSLNRIRAHHGLPASKDVKKSDQNLVTGRDQQ